MRKARVLLLALVVTGLMVAVAAAAERTFTARLSGGDVIPPAETLAGGEATFTLNEAGDKLTYSLAVGGITDVTAAHIHEGKKGTSGPPVVTLFGGPAKSGRFSGTLAEGTITDKDLTGSLQGKPLSALIKMIEEQGVYVNVHTRRRPDGEIRGQIQ